ncbi:MAG: DUF4012 domain-containing protein [Patescibacteria group bacterium]|nr:DUF4012 domain-containing protein [Patescibacteria group bacterium]
MIKDLSQIRKRKAKKREQGRLILKKSLLGLFGLFLVLGLISFKFVYVPAKDVFSSVRKVQAHQKPLKDAFLLQDLVKAKEELNAIEQDLVEVEKKAQRLSWLRFVPIARGYYLDGQRVIKSSFYALSAGREVMDAIEPVVGNLGLKTEENREVVELSMEDRIASTVRVLPNLADDLEGVEPELESIQEELSGLNTARYPGFLYIEGQSVRELVKQAKNYSEEFYLAFPKVQETLRVLPAVFGLSTPRRYAVIFQNDKEIRPTGGFWTAYALVTMSQGKMTDLRSGDMYFVDYRIDNKTPAPAVYQRFLKVDHWFIRDSNLSPDFKIASQKFFDFWAQAQVGVSEQAQFVNQMLGPLPSVDGVIALDTELVVEFLDVLGEVTVNGKTYDSSNVVLELEKEANIVRKEQEGRKALIGELMNAMFDKAFEAPENEWDDLVITIVSQANKKHLLLYFKDVNSQQWAEDMNWAGRIRDYDGDYLQLNEANFGGAKANLYVTRKVTQEIQKKNGKWFKTVTVDFENPEPYDGWLNGPYRSYVRLLVPEGAELVSIEGGKEAVPQESFFDEEIGKHVFATFNVTDPLDTSQLIFQYYLPESLLEKENYRVLIQKQPGKNSPEYKMVVGGKTRELLLTGDRELEFK